MHTETKFAVLAGGCFWGMEELFRKLPGVLDTQTGYTGGTSTHPTYTHHPGDAEAIRIEYNPTQISFEALLDFFFRIHDPTTLNRQGNDIGTSYRSAIFYANEEEKKEAEPEHQDYLQKNPGGYTCHYVRVPSYLTQK